MAPEVALGKPYNGAADVYGEQHHDPDVTYRMHLIVKPLFECLWSFVYM